MPDLGMEEAAIQRISAMLDPMADAAAQAMGMPPGGKQYTEDEQLEMWNYSPIASPQVRVETMIQLHALGKTPEEITDALYPKRRQVIEASHPSPTNRIQYARSMHTAMQKRAAEYQAAMQPPTVMDAPAPLAPESLPAMPSLAPTPDPVQPAASSVLDTPFSQLGG